MFPKRSAVYSLNRGQKEMCLLLGRSSMPLGMAAETNAV